MGFQKSRKFIAASGQITAGCYNYSYFLVFILFIVNLITLIRLATVFVIGVIALYAKAEWQL